jgi:putrescine transport system ATP-binding protein
MVTHDQEEAMSMASRMAVMNAGRIAQVGAPHEIYEAPSNRFVADFLGAVNFFAGRIEAVEGRLHRIASDEAGASLAVEREPALAAGRTVVVAVRPEKIAIDAAAPADAPNCLTGTVAAVSYRGEASTYRVALATGKMVRVTAPNTARRGGGFAEGSFVRLAWSAGAALVLEE